MESKTIYLILGVLSSLYIFIPMIGKNKESMEISTFLMSLGYGGYSLSKKDVTNAKTITREEYLSKSFRLQSTIGVVSIVSLVLSYILSINIFLTVLILVVFNVVASFIFWQNIKAYNIK